MELKKIELMGWAGEDKVIFEEQEDGSLMIETIPQGSFEQGHRILLDDAGRKRLMEFLQPVKRECDTCKYLVEIPSCQDPCYSCHKYDKWEEKAKV